MTELVLAVPIWAVCLYIFYKLLLLAVESFFPRSKSRSGVRVVRTRTSRSLLPSHSTIAVRELRIQRSRLEYYYLHTPAPKFDHVAADELLVGYLDALAKRVVFYGKDPKNDPYVLDAIVARNHIAQRMLPRIADRYLD